MTKKLFINITKINKSIIIITVINNDLNCLCDFFVILFICPIVILLTKYKSNSSKENR